MMQRVSRRRLLQSTAGLLAAGVAGCSTEVDKKEARVVGREPAALEEPVTTEIEVEVLVHNIGVASDVEITLEAVNVDDEVVASNSKVVAFGEDEQKIVYVTITPGASAKLINAVATVL